MFENVIYKMFTNHIYIYKQDLALNNIQWLICYNMKPIIIHQLSQQKILTASLQSGNPHPNECSGYDTKTDSEAPVMLELWGMRSTPSLPLLPCPLWPGVVALDRVISMG